MTKKKTQTLASTPVPVIINGRMNDALRDIITGMSVSMDVSTGEDDAEHRYFGTVSEVMDCDSDKHGVTILACDAVPNFTLQSAHVIESEPYAWSVTNSDAMHFGKTGKMNADLDASRWGEGRIAIALYSHPAPSAEDVRDAARWRIAVKTAEKDSENNGGGAELTAYIDSKLKGPK